MKKQVYGYLLLLTLTLGAYAQTSQVSTTTTENLRKHVTYLAADKLEGRRTGEAGAELAAAYVSNMFGKLGLKPGVLSGSGKGSFMQAFPYVTGVEMAKTGNDFSLRTGGKQLNRASSSVVPVGFSPNGTVSNAKVVFAGHGITLTGTTYDDYKRDGKPIDVTGSVVLVFDGNPDLDDPHSPFGRIDLRTKALIAKEHGAIGMLVISRERKFEDEKLARMGYDQTLGEAALPTFVISRSTASGILGAGEDHLGRMELPLANHPTVGSYTEPHDTHPVLSFKVNLIKKHADAHNVVGILEGNDPQLKNEAIVIGAHLDHLGRGGSGSLAANSTEIHHGADDNASGTAAIIELARRFASAKDNKRTLVFVAFSGEEEGLIGSKYYVGDPAFPLDKTVAMINLDMVGRLTNDKLNIGGLGTASEFKALIERMNTDDGLRMRVAKQEPKFNLALNDDGFGPSDHSSFYGKRVPVLFFFTGTHVDYHKPSDTADKINYEGLEKVMTFVADIVHEMDQSPVRPTYTVAKSSGMGGARSGFNISLGTIPSYADSTDGLVLDGVRDNSPAAAAGLVAGDKVVKLAGKDIRNVMDYTYVLSEMKAGEEYEIVAIRGGQRKTFKIIPVKR
ncbi:MAG: M20/M25/M40 family metallo-hydrolase [Pyrinomonadaceae bacterium]